MIIHQDCRHFRSDIPCSFHKVEGVHCEDCPHYDPIDYKILIVKLDAMGDVLRTTCVLAALKEKFPHSHITWLTRVESIPLLLNNSFVDAMMDYSPESFLTIQSESYDLVLGLDASPASAKATTLSNGKEKRGFGYDPRGYSYPLNQETKQWYEMGLFDDVKKRNTSTYQDIVFEACGLRSANRGIIYRVAEQELAAAEILRKKGRINGRTPVVGINPGAGGRWGNKKWPESNVVALIRMLLKKKYQVLLLGGEDEKELNARIRKKVKGKLIDSGCGHPVRDYAAIMNLCDLIVTMDTLSLHLGLALGKKVVALFGPTSAVEIEMYGKGLKIEPEVECQCYYRRSCTAQHHCMETISPGKVFAAIAAQLSDRS